MKIGVCSPFMPHDLMDLLDAQSRAQLAQLKGVTATPVTPLVREWHRLGHSIAVFTLDPATLAPVVLKGDSLTIHVLPKRRFRHCMIDVYQVERRLLKDAILAEKPDAISAQWSYEHALASLDSGLPTVVTCHDTPLRYAWISKSIFMTYHLMIAASVIRRSSRLVCVSPYTADHIQTYFRPKCVPSVIPNGIPDDLPLRGMRRLAAQRGRDDDFTICSIGGWGGIKNIKTLLKAFTLLGRSFEHARLVLFGSGLGAAQDAQRWAESRNLDRNVQFMGSSSRETLLEFLETEADMLVHPSLVETHGMVLLEAMACGVPVVAGTGSGAVPWTLGEGRYGYLCDVRSAQSLAGTMMSVLNDRELARRKAAAALKSVTDRFDMKDTAMRNLSILTQAAGDPTPRNPDAPFDHLRQPLG